MSDVTLEMVLTADVDGLRRSAATWDRLGRLLDDHADALAASLRRLPHVWETGPASTAASTHCTGLRQELDGAGPPVSAIAQALAQLAAGLAALRVHAEQLVVDGAAAHVVIRPDGSMQMAAGHSDEWTARSLSSLVWQRDEILQRAADLDARTARIIGQHTAVAAGAPAARVDRAAVPATGTDPAAVKRWWDSLSFAQR
ncbi:MAG TPA: hypothetical protein VFO77_12605, partial [Actinoplanes sp.]|nr:hypothetical protein [Actinoplanes sp.]